MLVFICFTNNTVKNFKFYLFEYCSTIMIYSINIKATVKTRSKRYFVNSMRRFNVKL